MSGDQIITRSIGSVRTLSRRGTWPGQEVQVLDGVVRQLGLAGLLHTQCIIYELTPPDILLSSSTKHREDINHLGNLLHPRPEHPQQQERTKIRNIIRNLNQVEESKKKEKSDKSKKKEIDDDDLNHKKKEKEPPEDVPEDPEEKVHSYSSKVSYLQEPGPGTRAGCPKPPHRDTSTGVQEPSSSSISLGSMGDCKVFCRSSGEGGGEIMVRNSGVLISGKNLGETEFFACSCSTAAAQMRGTVLAGNNISNITGGRKTTGIK